MKIIHKFVTEGTINRRHALFGGAVITSKTSWLNPVVIMAVSIHNPGDEMNDPLGETILEGRITKRWNLFETEEFINDTEKKYTRLCKFTDIIVLPLYGAHLVNQHVLEGIVNNFKNRKQKTLAKELGLKWNIDSSVQSDNELESTFKSPIKSTIRPPSQTA